MTNPAPANGVYRVYRKWAPRVAFAWYLAVVASLKDGNVLWMIWMVPFFFAAPLGAAERREKGGVE